MYMFFLNPLYPLRLYEEDQKICFWLLPDCFMSNIVVTLQKLAMSMWNYPGTPWQQDAASVKLKQLSTMDVNIGETWRKLFMGCSQNCLNGEEYSHTIIYYIPNVPSPIFDKYMHISIHLELYKLLPSLGNVAPCYII